VKVGVHPGFEDFYLSQFFKFRGVGFVVKGAGDKHVKA
jgi:hypothetical protein